MPSLHAVWIASRRSDLTEINDEHTTKCCTKTSARYFVVNVHKGMRSMLRVSPAWQSTQVGILIKLILAHVLLLAWREAPECSLLNIAQG